MRQLSPDLAQMVIDTARTEGLDVTDCGDVPFIVLAHRDGLVDKTVSNMQKVMARHGIVVLISDATGIAEAGAGCWKTLTLPEVAAQFAPILYSVPAQLLAYHTALALGADVDQLRYLAKSVTVE